MALLVAMGWLPHPHPLSYKERGARQGGVRIIRRGVIGKVESDFVTTNGLADTNLKILPLPTP